jgi:phosphinothricin acetyltransferase
LAQLRPLRASRGIRAHESDHPAGQPLAIARAEPVEHRSSALPAKQDGFREIGVYEKHGQLDGEWRDVVIVERLLI